MKNREKIVTIFVVVFIMMSVTSTFLWAGEAGDLVKQTIENGLRIIKDPALAGKDKTSERRKRLWEEIGPIFNMEEMAKRALGRHWRERTTEERKEYVELFTELIKNSYLEKTDTYSGEKVEFLREREDKGYYKVQTKFIARAGKAIEVDFSLINNSGKLQIYDVTIEGVSLVNNYRSQFNNFLLRSPFKALVQSMREKTLKD
ncbi:MAG: ABC transporter substrate-binding protein [Candidatus Scalindua sp. AMX11]|nr:MAG: ABC transporter substrate-binding protein [Candidatus Scalindua sp.]NOG84673.1 ABC transporter substrate-binding protein [Planctomycetota bacterium]RZV92444.1 MAG: ABC transporter substrate-binding protein [Candidatus Scalindua sp. SCAELEC01]TDE66027.1 MAG: ABC transporter substrate-binding protein [Candidatus Scalindua sp. AMX11]GJQ58998.1 MAG: toluene tolerance protein [Candidatus Scalindua sp.]